MTHTVVGLFDDKSDAQTAMNELVREGFVKENIDLSNRSVAAGQGSAGNDQTAGSNEGIGDKISNFFNSLFGDDETTARNYTNTAQDAEAILTVQADSDDRARLAQEIMDRNDAIDVDQRSAQYRQQNFSKDKAGMNTGNANDKTIPVVKESLDVGKREVERGGTRVRSRIIQKPVEESIRLREEHMVVNRRPVDREVSPDDLKNFRPGEIEITERAEVPIVGKKARVVEEVEIGKNVTEHEETVRDTVRATEVNVEKFDKSTVPNTKANRARP